ncbi:hypothetical protein MMC16_000014 [Acarospora aff. strigata]|nr:hypothetical protein [Acarospora aff. strigata]
MARLLHPLPLLELSGGVHNSYTKSLERSPPLSRFSDVLSCSSADLDAVEELECTPVQIELLQYDKSKAFVSLHMRLCGGDAISLDRIWYTWQALTSHNPILRTFILNRGTAAEPHYRQVIQKRPSFLRFGFQEDTPTGFHDDQPAYLEVSLQNDSINVRLCIHPALVDHTSLVHIRKDFALFYNGVAMEEHPSFSSYVLQTCKKDISVINEYWQKTLLGVVNAPIYSIPLHRDTSRSFAAAGIDEKLLQSLRTFGDEFSISMKGLMYAAWALTLARHTGASDNTATFAVVGRDTTHDDYQSLVGFVDQTYPLKVLLPPTMAVWKWIRTVEAANQDASANASIGYRAICDCSSPGFCPQVKLRFAEGFENLVDDEGHIDFPLTLSINLSATPAVVMHHNSTIPVSKIQVLLDHYLTCLSNIIKSPFSIIEEVDIVSTAEKRFLLEHGQPVTEPVEGLVNKLFEQQVEVTPDEPALQFENDEPLTYSQLNKLANRVARQLTCGRGAYVPVCMRRSAELIVALLAILKTGAAYATLDPEIPIERNSFIVKDLNAPFVLTDKHSAGHFRDEVTIESLIEGAKDGDATNLSVYQEPRDIVYVIYTSGSTGKPKGVLLEHAAAFSGLAAFPTIPHLRQLLFHNPIFSAAQRSIFSTLKQGGCLCIASKENLTVNIVQTINKMQINTIDVTPSTASFITPGTVPTLRRMTVAGELINPALLPLWAHRLELLNAYGLSENTQINWRRIMEEDQNPQNIGRPSDTTSSYVLVPGSTRLSPILVPGELVLGGCQLGREYLNRPEKTLEAFLENPFGPGRLYRTGDMVVAHEDGSIEMVGRIDFQTKINGQRVEPGEANSILQTHPSVYDASTVSAVVRGRKALVAVIVPRNGFTSATLLLELKEWLRRQLPGYMIPAYWLARDELPLNVNGKVDIPALRNIVQNLGQDGLLRRPADKADVTEHLTEKERIIRDLWCSVLSVNVPDLRLSDSFQGLGGTSLEAILVTSGARELSLDVRVQDIIQADSLSELAKASKWTGAESAFSSPEPFSLLPKNVVLDRDTIEDAYPTTPFQESMIADTLLGHSSYIYSRAFKLKGVKSGAIKEAFTTLKKNERLLRTTFMEHGRSFLQVIRKSVELRWDELEMPLDAYLTQQEQATMLLGEAFIKFAVLSEDTLVVTAHHALFDFWSNQFLYEDLSSVIRRQAPIERPPFSHFVKYILEQDRDAAAKFWKGYLDGATTTRFGFNPGKEISVNAKLDLDLKSFSSKYGITAGALLYTAWAIVLSVQTTENDIVFGVTLSGRDAPIPNILRISGPTLTTAPLRVKVDSELTLLDCAKTIQSGLWDMAQHAHYGMRNILRASGQGAGLFDTIVNFLLKDHSGMTNDILQPLEPTQTNHTDYVKLEMDDLSSNSLTLLSTLDHERAEAVIDNVVTVLSTLINEPDSSISDLQHRNLRNNQGPRAIATTISETQTLAHQMMEEMAAIRPDQIALQDNAGNSLSYADFNARTNRLAAYLRQKGIKPDDIVPLCLEKSIATLIAVFGVLKAGGAFTPLDPSYPKARNTFIINDVEANLAITDRTNAGLFDELGLEVILLDEVALAGYSDENNVVPTLASSNLVYTIYTSGSTGMPKGVLVTHAGLRASAEGMIEATGVTPSWKALWVLNYVFDGSYYDVFTVLGAGGTLCLAGQEDMLSKLAPCINELGVTQLMVTPSIAKLISPDEVPGLKVLLVGGEPLTPNILEVWATRMPVYNGYGPTEATILMTVAEVKPNSNIRSIGHPLKFVTPCILDVESLEPAAFGSVGELCVSGPHLARGYLKRPEATKSAFVTDKHGARIYRTGDLARWLPDGQIECFGRKDKQVKINGFRIELGEIENAILNTGEVRDCVVAVALVQKKRQLVAFCVHERDNSRSQRSDGNILLAPDQRHDTATITANLTTLPHYMVPSLWLPFASFPLLPSGKTDTKALIALAESADDSLIATYMDSGTSAQAEGEDSFTPPQDHVQQILQEAWGQVFDVPSGTISVTAKFYAYGGDSISAINLVSACRRLGYNLAVNDVLTFSTLSEQAKCMEAIGSVKTVEDIKYQISGDVYERLRQAGISDSEVEDIYPCAPGQVEFLTQGSKRDQFWQLMTVRRLPADFDFERWLELTVKLTSMNQILRAMYLKADRKIPSSWVQVVLKKPVMDLEVLEYNDSKHRRDLIEEAWNSFFQVGKPFVRYRLLTSRQDGTRDLCIKLDHAMYDGTLLRIFDDQFTAMDRGEPVAKPIEFKKLVDYCHTSDRKKNLSFWTDLLQGNTFTYPSQVESPKVGGLTLGKIDSSTIKIDAFAQSCGVTVPIVLQTAYTLLLGRLSDSRDVTYDNLITGRNVDLDDPQLINGNCANFLPFRSRFSNNTPIKDLMKDTQSLFWKTTDHGLVSLQDIYDALRKDRHTHSAKTMFCFQPFEPPPKEQSHMRWVVMSLSEVTMFFPYAIMLEVFKDVQGYKMKLQYDNTTFSKSDAELLMNAYLQLLQDLIGKASGTVADLIASCLEI